MPPDPLELVLPEALDPRAAVELLSARLGAGAAPARTGERVLLDTFDGRLRGAGLRAEHPAGSGATVTLQLREPGRPARRAEVAAAPAYPPAALPPGPLRERLAPVLEDRALLPVARLRSRTAALAVVNGDEKTVVRLIVEHAEAVAPGRGTVPLAPRLRVEPVRGYDGAFDRTARTLRDELGLEPAPRPLFDEAVTAAGGRPEGVSTKVRVELARGTRADVAAGAVLLALAGVAEANVPGTRENLDPEFLHDLRVSVRRARSVLRELDGVHPPAERARLRGELRWAQELTGPSRDLDVQLLEWAHLPGAADGELEPLRELLERRQARAHAAMRRGLAGRRFTALLASWRALAAAAPGDGDDRPLAGVPIEAVAAHRIRRIHRRIVRDGRAIGPESPDGALHDLRKRGKELRYMLELFGGLFPSEVVKPLVRRLKELQDVLGRFQDLVVQAEQLRGLADDLAGRPGGPDALLALGTVLATLERERRETRAHFGARFDAFAAKEQRALVRDTFPKLERT